MKRFGLLVICVVSCTASLYADYQKGSQSFSLMAGGPRLL